MKKNLLFSGDHSDCRLFSQKQINLYDIVCALLLNQYIQEAREQFDLMNHFSERLIATCFIISLWNFYFYIVEIYIWLLKTNDFSKTHTGSQSNTDFKTIFRVYFLSTLISRWSIVLFDFLIIFFDLSIDIYFFIHNT